VVAASGFGLATHFGVTSQIRDYLDQSILPAYWQHRLISTYSHSFEGNSRHYVWIVIVERATWRRRFL